MAGDAGDESAQDERGDDDFDEAEEDVAQHAELYGEGGRVEAEFETGKHGEEDPEGEGAIAKAGDGEEEKTDATNGDKGFVMGKRN